MAGISEALAEELAPLGIKVLVIDPGYFRTSLLSSNGLSTPANRIEDYNSVTNGMIEKLVAVNGKQPGDPKKGVKVIVDVVTGSGPAEGKKWPVRLPLGSDAVGFIRAKCQATLQLLDEWQDITTSTDHDDVQH